jgi:uncharacterized protein
MNNATIPRPLEDALSEWPGLAIAVSGGVDSLTLAHAAQVVLGERVAMLHAVSPAVPSSASDRVERHAARGGWRLTLIDAGEFDDPRYRANPVDRCYFCKTNLYARIRRATTATIASGTNLDDLGDYRPGLKAASEHGVVHPYVEAGLRKRDVYALATALGLDDLAELPAQPCLSSRVETGIAIDAADLGFIDALERRLADELPAKTDIRVRVRHGGVAVELGIEPDARVAVIARKACAASGRLFLGVERYRRGSAFLR